VSLTSCAGVICNDGEPPAPAVGSRTAVMVVLGNAGQKGLGVWVPLGHEHELVRVGDAHTRRHKELMTSSTDGL